MNTMSSSDEYSEDEEQFNNARARIDDSMDGDFQSSPVLRRAESKSKVVSNQPFDEAVEMSSDDSEMSPQPQQIKRSAPSMGMQSQAVPAQQQQQQQWQDNYPPRSTKPVNAPSDSDEDSPDESGSPASRSAFIGGYNPDEYMNLPVSTEIHELFQYITRYKPADIELDVKLQPFVPEYIPAIGELDAFLKIPRPDGQPDNLGLTVLDEPALGQSDPAVMEMHLRAFAKAPGLQPVQVRSIEGAEKNPKAITSWITSIEALHREKPPATVLTTKAMPDLEALMQEWPAEFEEILSSVQLPGPDLDVDVATYARIICSILDIPVYQNIVESLHHLFSLYIEFQSNVHFKAQANAQSETI